MLTPNDVAFRFEFLEGDEYPRTPCFAIFADTEKTGACEILPTESTYKLNELVTILRRMADQCVHIHNGGTLVSFVRLKEGQQ